MSMEMKQDNGGPAFPVGNGGAVGMSLRDYFAAKAMQALIASNDDGAGDRIDEIPTYAYDIADAMLAARARALGRNSD
jgi:hypothetical protein